MSFYQSQKRGRLRDCHDGSERQRITMGIVTIGDTADGMARNLDGGLGNVLVVVCGASLPEILEMPWNYFSRLQILLWPDTRQIAQRNKTGIRSTAAASKNWFIRQR